MFVAKQLGMIATLWYAAVTATAGSDFSQVKYYN